MEGANENDADCPIKREKKRGGESSGGGKTSGTNLKPKRAHVCHAKKKKGPLCLRRRSCRRRKKGSVQLTYRGKDPNGTKKGMIETRKITLGGGGIDPKHSGKKIKRRLLIPRSKGAKAGIMGNSISIEYRGEGSNGRRKIITWN